MPLIIYNANLVTMCNILKSWIEANMLTKYWVELQIQNKTKKTKQKQKLCWKEAVVSPWNLPADRQVFR